MKLFWELLCIGGVAGMITLGTSWHVGVGVLSAMCLILRWTQEIKGK